jgi:N-acetylmuramic acid 6-phosphate etherase
MIRLGKVFRGRMVDLVPTNSKLRARAERIIAELAGVSASRAAALARAAGHRPNVALAMYLTGVSRREAERMLETRPLRSVARRAGDGAVDWGRGAPVQSFAGWTTRSGWATGRRCRRCCS